MRGWSFGFLTNRDTWEKVNDNLQRRYLTDIDLLEVSLLTVEPAYSGCLAEVRKEGSLTEVRFNSDTVKEVEKKSNNELEELRKFGKAIQDIFN